jgi:hypothetical protein
MTDHDLTPLLLDALGTRVGDPAAIRLASAIGKKPFKSATPNSSPVFVVVDRKRGLEIATGVTIRNRAYWPSRKEGRLWLTWVSHAFIYPSFQGSLPVGLDWQMDDAALSARFKRRIEGVQRAIRFTLPPPREGLSASVELNDDGRPKHLFLSVTQERDYATIYPETRPEHTVESGFFAAWCALQGVLREGRLDAETGDALRARRITPRTFFATVLGGLLWQWDVEPEFDPFCYAYTKRLMEPEEASSLHDARQIFGESNYWRKADESMTEDSWVNYDRIAPRYSQRLEQWRRGEINSTVDHPK